MAILATALLLALSRAEIVARFRAPVLSQADGNIKVFAACAEDVRREYQAPVARFAGETFAALARAARRPLARAASPTLILHLGDVRTNRADVVVRAATNGASVVTRVFIPNPATANLDSLRVEVVRAYCRAAERRELAPAEAEERWLMTNPEYRLAQDRRRLQEWLDFGRGDDDEGFRLLYRVFRPGTLSEIEVRVFASRLRLYPQTFGEPFLGRHTVLSFSDAIRLAKDDSAIRVAARRKADEILVFGGGRGNRLRDAAKAYRAFLLALASGTVADKDLEAVLKVADMALKLAAEEAGAVMV